MMKSSTVPKSTPHEALTLGNKFVDFVNASPTPFHVVSEVKRRLVDRGYKQLNERDTWKIERNGKYFITRNHSSIIAFAIGGAFKPGNGFKIIGAHTDSPDLRLKPVSSQSSHGYIEVGVQTYGGGLWYTWFDRDLTIAGRVLVEYGEGDHKQIAQRLVRINKPILKIPTLAVHFNRESANNFSFNNENHLLPIIGTINSQLLQDGGKKEEKEKEKQVPAPKHHQIILDLLAKELSIKPEQIKDLELSVVDFQPATIGGINDEFIFAQRIDNLVSCFCAMEAMINSTSDSDSLASDPDVRVAAFFDHEEVGSTSAQGAASCIMKDLIERLTKLLNDGSAPADAMNATIGKSFIISCDMAHAVHPSYSEKHQEKHKPEFHKGPVIKVNANQRYATNAVTSFLLTEIARRNEIPYQEFVVRNDIPCGTTIGPVLSAGTGIRTVDVGNPQLSMHSIRETCATTDLLHTVRLFQAYFEQFRELDDSLKID